MSLWLPADCRAQVAFTPDHPDVEAMVRRGIAYLESAPQNDHGEATLAALAVLEAGKRYENEIPFDHPLVVRALEYVLADVARLNGGGEGQPQLAAGGLYYACLATILLLELDDRRYEPEIKALLNLLRSRKQSTGAYGYGTRVEDSGDTSQSQYVCLAWAVADLHGFELDKKSAADLLDWFIRVQMPGGHWVYHYTTMTLTPSLENSSGQPLALAIAGAGTVYLLGDLLRLNPRARSGVAARGQGSNGLPRDVSVHVRPRDGKSPEEDKDGPRVQFDTGRLSSSKRAANNFLGANFRVNDERWNYYTLYGFERYAYFREKAEGEVKEHPTWYDQGTLRLQSLQEGDGSWGRGSIGENRNNATCFAILFLVRSSQILMLDRNTGLLNGQQGFALNTRLRQQRGQLVSDQDVKNIEDIMEMLRTTESADDLASISESLGPAIKQFTEKSGKSRGEQTAFLRGLVTDENYNKRLVAIRFLASQQDLDNVPALLYALTDPDLSICREAHNGLRLISRKLDAFPIPDNATRSDFEIVRKNWTEWFLALRPDAQLMDDQ